MLFRIAAMVCLAGMVGCAIQDRLGGTVDVSLGGRTFVLEVAEDDIAQQKGLGGRREIARDGGMIFVFAEPAWQSFVMRDCAIPIDLVYLDEAGRVLSVHAMTPEAPRSLDEAKGIEGELLYMARLKSYASEGDAKYAVEFRGGTIAELGIEKGDVARSELFRAVTGAR